MAGEFYVSGLTGTFDWSVMLDQILQLRSIPIARLENEKSLIQTKLSILGEVKKGIDDLYSLFESLDVNSLFTAKYAVVSNPDVLTASVTEEAPNIEFNVTVNKLSQVEIRVSNGGVADLTTGFSSSGTLTISYDTGNGVETFSVDYSAGQTLEDLVNAINNAQNRVKASIYFDGSVYRLMLSEADAGASTVETDTVNGIYVINVSGLPAELGTGLDTIQNAQNAEIVIGSGNPVTSPTNTFENVISGITINVKSLGSSEVRVSEDYSKVTGFLSDFVEKYNALNDTIKKVTREENSPFRGDYTIGRIGTNIANLLDPLINLGLIDYEGETGRISLNTDRLNQLLQDNPQEVKTAIENLKTNYTAYLQAQRNLFEGIQETFNEKIERIDERIETLLENLSRLEIRLRREFSQLEAFIAQAEQIRERLKQFMVSLSEATGQEG